MPIVALCLPISYKSVSLFCCCFCICLYLFIEKNALFFSIPRPLQHWCFGSKINLITWWGVGAGCEPSREQFWWCVMTFKSTSVRECRGYPEICLASWPKLIRRVNRGPFLLEEGIMGVVWVEKGQDIISESLNLPLALAFSSLVT